MVVVVETERLQLRQFDTGDAGFILDLLNDPGWLRHIGDRGVRSLDDARQWIESRLIDGYQRQGFGFWAVHRRGETGLLGLCGLIKRDTLPEVDVGYAFLPQHRGQGYAREATRACLLHGHQACGLRRILAITSPENIPSQRVLDAVGMKLVDRRVLTGEAHATWVYAWEAAAG